MLTWTSGPVRVLVMADSAGQIKTRARETPPQIATAPTMGVWRTVSIADLQDVWLTRACQHSMVNDRMSRGSWEGPRERREGLAEVLLLPCSIEERRETR